jgi:hypothetical protein
MTRKSLILYVSMTGNTEKVALKIKDVFEKKGAWGDWECDILKVDRHNYRSHGVNINDYDFLCVGSPILHGTSAKEFPDALAGVTPGATFGPEGGGPPPWASQPGKSKRAVVFVTYTGDRRGPPEATPTLARLEAHLNDMGWQVVGKLAVPGKIWRKGSVDNVATKFYNLNVEEASAAIARYQENPQHAEFAKLSKEDRALFDTAVKTKDDADPMWKYQRIWHYDVQKRPNERDLLKAQIFMEEILEDYYQPNQPVEATSASQYLCIA